MWDGSRLVCWEAESGARLGAGDEAAKSDRPRHAGQRQRQCRGLSCTKPHSMGGVIRASLRDETASCSEGLDFLPTIPPPSF